MIDTKHKINIAVIGAGRIGKIHCENLASALTGAELTAIADVNLKEAKETATRLNVPMAVPDYAALLADPDIEAVVICSPTDTHAKIIQEAAAAGKHIFCEKPIDHELSKVDQALDAVEQAGIKLMVGFNRRFDPNFQKVRNMVAEGKIGEPHILHIISRDPAPPTMDYLAVSGGIFLDMTIHDFDMARYLMASEVSEIYVAGAVLVDPKIGAIGDLDTVIITLRFTNGAIGTIDNSREAVYGYDQRVEVFGSKGMIATYNPVTDTHIYSNQDGINSALPLNFFLERYSTSYIIEMREFIECLQNNTPPPVSGMDGRVPIVMGLAAKKSYQENRPVQLSEVDGSEP
ncbi:MAG: inositol 2-dehydrogenase [Chloroflexi bacterium]|nr:inositol 2-dehydrogenase [Chloroflexota bacterium]